MFNSGIRGRRARDGEGSLQITDVFIQKNNPFVTISRYSILDGSGNAIDDLALDTAGGQTVLVVGGGFETGVTVTVGGTAVSPVVRLDSTRLTFTSPAKTSGSQALVVNNVNGSSAVFVPGLAYSGTPTFVTTAGTLGTVYETTAISTTISATSDSAITYTLDSGTLPPGSTLSSGGLLTGTAPADAASTTYTFTVRATDAELQESTRQFSITVATDVVSWQYPEDQDIVVIDDLEPNIVLDAVSAAGSSISYAASALPTGLSLSNGVITGTVSVEEDTAATLTATADTTTRSAAISVTWRVSLGDSFFKNTTLLLNGDATAWITDSSPNGFTITPSGDARPSAFSPYNTNWSNYFDGGSTTERRLTTTQTAIGTGNFTVAFWLYIVGTTGTDQQFFDTGASGFTIAINSSNQLYLFNRLSASAIINASSSTAINLNTWVHIAVVRSGTGTSQFAMYINGTSVGTGTSSSNFTSTTISIGGRYAIDGSTWYTTLGYISNLLYVDSALSIAVPTSTYTNQSGVKLLTCQSNRFIDNSTNNFAITRNGDVKVTAFGPFAETDNETGSGYFDGTGDYLTAPANAAFNFASGDFTVECWFYRIVSETVDTLLQYGNAAVSNYNNISWSFFVNSTNYSGFEMSNGVSSTFLTLTSNTLFPLNVWVHMSVVRSGNNFTMYQNGVSVATGTTTQAFYISSDPLLWIGRNHNAGTADVAGYISNARIVKGTAVYTSAFTPPSSPLTAISNTSLLTLQSRRSHNNNTFLDDSGNRFNLTRAGNATQGTFSPFSPSGWSVYFDGTGDVLTIPDSALSQLGSSDFTVECWFNTLKTTSQQILTKGVDENVTWGNFAFSLNNSGYVNFQIDPTPSTSADQFNLIDNVAINDGQWHHVAVTRSGSTWRLFRDGVIAASGTNSSSFADDSYAWVVGGTRLSGSTVGTWLGYISNLRLIKGNALYTSNFTPSSIPLSPVANTAFLICRSNNIIDEGPNRFTITRVGDSRITPFSPFKSHTITPNSYSFYFDGTGDYLTIPADANRNYTSNWTVEGWFYMSSGQTGNWPHMMSFKHPDNNNTCMLAIYHPDKRIYSGFDGAGNINLTPNNTIQFDTWYHFVWCKSGSTHSAWVNGVRTLNQSTDTRNISSSTGRGNWYIGSYRDGGANFKGYMSNWKVSAEALYNPADATITVPTAPLSTSAETDLLSCQSPTIVDNSTNDYAITVNGNTQPTKFNPFGETVTSDVQYSPTTHGGSLLLDGSGDYLTIPPNSNLAFGTGDFTIEFWLSSTVFSRDPYDRRILRCISNPSTGAGAGFGIALNGDPTTGIGQLGGGTEGFGATGLATSGTVCNSGWHHIVLGRKSSILYLFHNGILQGSTSNSNNITDPSTYNIYVGWFGTAQGFFNGYLHGVKLIKGSFVYPTSNFVPPSAVTSFNSSIALNFTNAGIQDSAGRNVLETVGDTGIVSESPYSRNKSVYFDGTGDAINAVGTTEFQFGTGDFIVECFVFVNLLNTGDAQYVVSTYDGSNGGWALYLSSSCTAISFRNGDAGVVNRSFVFSANTWYHILVSRVSSTLRFFVNGDKVGADENSYTQNITRNNTYGCSIGRYQTSINQVGAYVNGYVSNVRVVKGSGVTSVITPTSPLTAVSGTSLLTCQSYNFKDNSANNFTITKNGDAKITSRGPFTETLPYVRSMSFDGTGDYIQVPASQFDRYNFNTGDFTIECWIYPTALGLDDVIVASYSSWATSVNFYFGTRAGSPNIIIFRGGNSVPISINGNTAINLNTWHHVAVTRTSGVTRMFVDGITQTATHTGTVNVGATVRQMYIGCNNEIGELWTGYMEDLRITKGIARYTANFTPNSRPFKTR